jgi:hypothetical protein
VTTLNRLVRDAGKAAQAGLDSQAAAFMQPLFYARFFRFFESTKNAILADEI